MLTSELSFTAQLRKSVTLSRPLCHYFSIRPDTEMPAASDADHKNKLLKGLKGGMNIHMGDLRGEEALKLDCRVSSHAPVSLNDSNTNPFRSLWAHGGEKHLHTNTNMPPHTHTHTHTRTHKGYKIWLALFLFTIAKSITVNVLQLIWNTLANCDLKPRIVIPNQTDESALSLSLSLSLSLHFPSLLFTHTSPKLLCVFHTWRSALIKRGHSTSKIFGLFSGRFRWTPDWFVWCLCVRVCMCVCVCAHACVCVCVCVSDIIPREHQTVLQQLPADTRPVASRWPPPHTYTHTHTHTHTHTTFSSAQAWYLFIYGSILSFLFHPP